MRAAPPEIPATLSGSTALYAILGDPIAQVASPRLFNAAFRERGMDAVLVAMHVAPAGLASAFAAFRSTENAPGLVVTVPHKIAALDLVEDLGPEARRTGALNAVVKTEAGRLLGENFDGTGFVRGLAKAGHRTHGRRALVIGAGGAGRAVAHALINVGVASLGITDLNPERVRLLISSLHADAPDVEAFVAEPRAAGFDMIVNCTSVGMREDDPLPLDIAGLEASTLVADIVLKPRITRLLSDAKARGCPIQEGIHMLEGQVDAVIDFFNARGRIA